MKELEKESGLIRRYLLGGLPEAEQEQFERRVLSDPEYREMVEIVEDELIEDYARGDLSEADRERFVEHFVATPPQAQKLQLVQALQQYAEAAPPPPALLTAEAQAGGPDRTRQLPFWRARLPRLRFALAAACVILLAVALIFYIRQQSNGRASLEQELARLNSRDVPDRQGPDASVLTATLSPTLTRDTAETNKITVSPGIDLVVLRLNLPSGGQTIFQIRLRTNEGAEIFVLPNLNARETGDGRQLGLKIPARLLTRGDYRLRVERLDASKQPEEVTEYYFRVVTQSQN